MNENYYFFWHGSFSNWAICPMYVYGVKYNCVEQYMMAMKAVTFNDMYSYRVIMATAEPAKQKKLGRGVVGFDEEVWDKLSPIIVFKGVLEKFRQNGYMLEKLRHTGDKILVEASPYDKIWGIGLSEQQALVTPSDQWPGENRLGKIITEVKSLLLPEVCNNG